MIRRAILATFLLLVWPHFVSAQDCDPEGKTLRVGVVLGLTGSASYQADAVQKGLGLAEEELRQLGWKLDVVYEDDQTLPRKTLDSFRSLMVRGYRLFIGPLWSFQVKAISPVLEREGVLSVIPTGSSVANGGASDALFSLCLIRSEQQSPIETFLSGLSNNTALIYVPNGDWGEIHSRVFSKAIGSSGGELFGEERFDYGVDLSTAKSVLLRYAKKQPGAIFTTGGPADVAQVVRARNQLSLKAAVISTEDVRDAVRLGLLQASDLEKEVYAVHLSVSEKFQALHMKRYNEEAKLYSARAYDALKILAEGVCRTDGTPASVRAYFREKLDHKGYSGRIRFDQNGDIKDGAYSFTRVR